MNVKVFRKERYIRLDGDGFGVIENEVLYDCVIEEEYPFINKDDGESVEHEFTREQLFKDIIASSGNIIGSIAISNSKLCAEVTHLDNIIIDHRNAYTYNQLKNHYFEHKGYEVNSHTDKEQKKALNKEFNEKFNEMKADTERDILILDDFNNISQRSFLKQLFHSHKKDFFNILYASQLAIDMPKSLTSIPEEVMEKLEKYKYLKKPVFMHYLNKCSCRDNGNKNVENCKDIVRWIKDGEKKNVKKESNMMDKFCKYIVKELLIDDIKEVKGQENSSKLIKLMDYNCDEGKINEELLYIYEVYKEKRNKLLEEKENLDTKKYNMKLDLLDKATLDAVESIDISNEDVVSTLKNIKNVTVRFILTFLWNVLKTKVEERDMADLITYKEDINGEIDWLFKRYSKVENTDVISEEDEMKKLKKKLLKKTGQGDEIRIGGYEGLEITDEMYICNRHLFRIVDNTDIGYIFDYEKKNLVNGQVLKIIDYKVTGKNNNSVTMIYENI